MVGARVALAAALVLSLLGGCAAAAVWDGSPPQAAGPQCGASVVESDPREGPSFVPNQGALNEIAVEIGQLGETRFRSVYAGVAIDTDADRVDVWSKYSAAFAAEVGARSWAVRVRWHVAPHSAAELEPTFHRLIEDHDYWRSRGLPVFYAGVRHEGTYIEVGTPDPTRAESAFRRRYPGAPFCFFVQTQGGIPFGEPRT